MWKRMPRPVGVRASVVYDSGGKPAEIRAKMGPPEAQNRQKIKKSQFFLKKNRSLFASLKNMPNFAPACENVPGSPCKAKTPL